MKRGCMLKLTIQATDGHARTGQLKIKNSVVPTPVFMPVGTQATVKMLDVDEVSTASEGLILSNTYHLWLQPGASIVKNHGGLHQFMQWPGLILTDSGGYQVFSLKNARKIYEEGVHFKHHKSGDNLVLTPEKSIQIQNDLGADIIMSFDECPPFDAPYEYHRESLARTLRWAQRGKDVHQRPDQALFGIVQGGPHMDLRRHSLEALVDIGFDGYAIGGLSVGESRTEMYQALFQIAPEMPADKPRYLMGVGTPEDLLAGVEAGIDMFDCVNPTRIARHGVAYTALGPITIKNKPFEDDSNPIDAACECPVCQRYSRSYIRHLYKASETLGPRLISFHNLIFLKRLMQGMREAISEGRFQAFKADFLKTYQTLKKPL